MRFKIPASALLIFAMCYPLAAQAYIGPGAGLSAIGTLVGVVGAVLLAIVGFVWYPVKRMLKGRKKAKATASEDDVK